MTNGRPRRSSPAVVAILVVLLFTAAAVWLRWGGSSGPGEQAVAIQDFAYQPGSLTVEPGTTVEWTNLDVVPHSVTAADGSWDSGQIAPGATWSRSSTTRATETYTCTLHPQMTGELVTR